MSEQVVLNASQSVNTIELNAKTSSTISHISLYGSRAEVVRVFKFEAPAGQNTVNVTELPAIIQNSLRSVVPLWPSAQFLRVYPGWKERVQQQFMT